MTIPCLGVTICIVTALFGIGFIADLAIGTFQVFECMFWWLGATREM